MTVPQHDDGRTRGEPTFDEPARRLAAYGSLRPGESNHHHVAALAGTWRAGTVRGHVARLPSGHLGLRIDRDGPPVPVAVLESDDLPAAWSRLDRFEGAAYQRVLVVVELAEGGTCVAHAYVAKGLTPA